MCMTAVSIGLGGGSAIAGWRTLVSRLAVAVDDIPIRFPHTAAVERVGCVQPSRCFCPVARRAFLPIMVRSASLRLCPFFGGECWPKGLASPLSTCIRAPCCLAGPAVAACPPSFVLSSYTAAASSGLPYLAQRVRDVGGPTWPAAVVAAGPLRRAGRWGTFSLRWWLCSCLGRSICAVSSAAGRGRIAFLVSCLRQHAWTTGLQIVTTMQFLTPLFR